MHDQPRQKRPAAEVMAEVQAAAPKLVPFMFMDGAWIWYCGPTLRDDAASRRALSEIGFRFAKRGHVMPDKQTRAYWGHSCDRPTRSRRHNNRHRPAEESHHEEQAEHFDPAAILAAL